jgi:anti-sigma regulatory factor (Ser/Thr protein kinase)
VVAVSPDPHAPTDVSVAARDIGTAVVLALDGELDQRTAPRVRTVLEKHLADRGRVLVDVSGLTTTWPPAVEVFPLALASMCGWPAARLVLFGAGPRTADALRARPCLPATVHLADTEAAAVELLDVRPSRLSRRTEIDPEPEAAKWARILVETVCADWDVDDPEAASAACIVASELVTNVVVHARTRCVLTVTRTPRDLRVGVRDHDTGGRPVRSDAARAGARGLGLVVVAGVSRSWGVTVHGDGKTVWALVPAPPRGRA